MTALALIALVLTPAPAPGQEAPLAWAATADFRYEILNVSLGGAPRTVTVVLRVINPRTNTLYDILDRTKLTFTPPATLRVNVGWNTAGWNTTELINTGSTPVPGTFSMTAIVRTWMNFTPPNPGGVGPSYPNVVNALTSAKPCSSAVRACGTNTQLGVFYVTSVLPSQAVGWGRVAIEGHPVLQTGVTATGAPVLSNIPVKSVYQDFRIDRTGSPRRKIVEFAKCQGCHDGGQHGDTVVPRLSLHGGNRNEEPELCVMCHNPGQTDAAYRTSGTEVSVDFKRLVHGIHSGGFRKTPLVIVGFRGAVTDFSYVRFPGTLRNCVTCHIDSNGKGTFELPPASLLGSTVQSGSVLSTPGLIDVNPADDLKISPIAAACSGCHDSGEVRDHMVRMGASFGVNQAALQGKELCVNCHGPGRTEDVRRAHEIRSTSTSGD